MTDPRIARNIAIAAHDGQFRRDKITPYINHPLDVAKRVARFGSDYESVAYLHDVLEDTNVTAKDLAAAGISYDVIVAVELLTKNRDTSYEEYLSLIKLNELARAVKIADMLSNLADSPTNKQIAKYARGLLTLVKE